MFANQIFVQKGFPWRSNFQALAADMFFSGIESVDFLKANDTAKTINQFVKDKTKNYIKEIVKQEIINEKSRLVLVNAIFFPSEWERQFSRCYTQKRDFFNNGTEKVPAHFIHIKQSFWHAQLKDLYASAVRLDYANSNLSFVIILPNHMTGLDALESQLYNYDLMQIIGSMGYNQVRLKMPKLKIESQFSLKGILEKVLQILFISKKMSLIKIQLFVF